MGKGSSTVRSLLFSPSLSICVLNKLPDAIKDASRVCMCARACVCGFPVATCSGGANVLGLIGAGDASQKPPSAHVHVLNYMQLDERQDAHS